MSTYVRLTDFEFEDTFRPIRAKDGSWRDFSWVGPDDLPTIQQAEHERRLWTIIDFDGVVGLGSGNHLVNRLGYVITEVPVPDNVLIDVIDDDDLEDLERQGNQYSVVLSRADNSRSYLSPSTLPVLTSFRI